MPSPAERLLAAADLLDKRASEATEGPWRNDSGPDSLAPWTVYDREWSVAHATTYDHDNPLSNKPGARGPGYIDPAANARYIATMHPEVGKLLARVLRSYAEGARGLEGILPLGTAPESDLLALADLVLAGEHEQGS